MPRPGPRLPSASAPRPALRSRCAARGTAPVTTRRSPGPAAAGPAGQAGGAPLAVPAHVRRAVAGAPWVFICVSTGDDQLDLGTTSRPLSRGLVTRLYIR